MTTTPRVALLYPPLTDPTSGYHSLSYIDSYARARGHAAADLIDTNIEAFHHSYSPAGLAWLDRALAGGPGLGPYGGYQPHPDEMAAHLLRVGEPDPERTRQAVDVLRDPVRFYDYGAYRQAADSIISWMDCLGSTGVPGQFRYGFTFIAPPPVMIGSVRALTDHSLLAQLSRPFQSYYETILLPKLRRGGYDMIGINITYVSQLPFAIWLAHLIRRALPDVFLVAGGTEVSDVWKNAREPEMVFQVFADLDAIVVGEGETAYTELLESRAAGRLPIGEPNIRLHPKYGPVPRSLPMLRYEKLGDIPTPDFSRLPWHLYLSPERFVYYSPSRGCYWNKCTFCDYGLNTDGPTSPWRQDSVDTMIRDVTELSKFSKFIYFSVDVLAPARILNFAEAVVQRGLDIRWGAEIRLEKYWSPERCALLKRAGCTSISVGFESANQRVLDLIDKGTRPEQVKQTVAAMHGAGIGVQMMGFTGFPTETREEAFESIQFLVDHRDKWTFGGLGEFVLTPGAIVAKQPERFGITNLRPVPHADVSGALLFDEPISQSAEADVRARKLKLTGADYPRPWLGATDTPHTYFYTDRYGVRVREPLVREGMLLAEDESIPFVLNGTPIATPPKEVLARYCAHYQEVDTTVPKDRLVFRRDDGRLLIMARRMWPLLRLFAVPRTIEQVRELTWLLPAADTEAAWQSMVRLRLIRRHRPHPITETVAAAGVPLDAAGL